ncbi:MAG: hypothetical protein CMP51_04750 [Flavobacteriales bacterium]|nr:hypothetical protein [Flavobacteriales bacterium]|tara:strand:+ start:146 stop:589 length:444 start_codon:yes stop_codon:yes gene_type:complete
MNNYFLKTLFSILFIGLFTNTFSQTNEWIIYYENEKISIETKHQICEFSSTANQEIIIFRFTNLTNDILTLEYDTELSYGEQIVNTEQNGEESRKKIKINKNEIIVTNCDSKWNEFNIFSAFIENKNKQKYIYLSQFELKNINTENE